MKALFAAFAALIGVILWTAGSCGQTMTATTLDVTNLVIGRRTIDQLIAAKTAGNTSQLLYSTYNVVTGECIRSTTCWANPVNLTCASPWNSQGGNLGAGTAITPRHIALTTHINLNDGTTILFIAADNTVVTRTVTATQQVGTTQLTIGLLSSDLPASIRPAKVLPDNWSGSITAAGLAVMNLNQEERASVADLVSIANEVTIGVPTNPQRLAFHTDRVVGDSGNPIFLLVNGEAVLLFCFDSTTSGPSPIGNNRTAVESAISTLGAFGHALTDVHF